MLTQHNTQMKCGLISVDLKFGRPTKNFHIIIFIYYIEIIIKMGWRAKNDRLV